jgi:hypothetical protein
MPYKSLKQAGKFHEMEKRGEMKPSVVKEFDKASKGMKLPERAPKANGDEHMARIASARMNTNAMV